MNPEIVQFLVDSIQAVAEIKARSDAEYQLVLIQIVVSSATAIIVAILAFFQHQSHKQFNSRMDELKTLWVDKAFEAGKKEEREGETKREKP